MKNSQFALHQLHAFDKFYNVFEVKLFRFRKICNHSSVSTSRWEILSLMEIPCYI